MIWIVTCWSVEVKRDDVHRVVSLKAEKKQWKWFTSWMLPDFCKGVAFVWRTPRCAHSSFCLRVAVKKSEVFVSMMYKNTIRSLQKTLYLPYKGQSVNALWLIVAVYCHNRIKCTYIRCGPNAGLYRYKRRHVQGSGVPRGGGFGVFKPPPPQFRRYRWSPRSHEQEEPASRFPFVVHCVLIRL